MSTRTTRKPTKAEEPLPVTRGEAIAALKDYTLAHIKCEHITVKAKASVEKLKAITEKRLKPWEDEKEHNESILHRYANENPELFAKARKIELYGGHKVGFQTNPPKVDYVRLPGEKKKQNDEGFLARCKALGGALLDYVRKVTAEVPNKELILKKHSELADAAELALEAATATAPLEIEEYIALTKFEAELRAAGVVVTQSEDFVIVLNLQPEGPKTP